MEFRLHHIGFVVSNLDDGRAMFSALGAEIATPPYHDPIQRVSVQFLRAKADVLVELITPAAEKSPVNRFLAERGAGLHHLCYEVSDIDAACDYLRSKGSIITCAPVEAVAFGGRKIAFHYWNKQIIELVEAEKS